MSDILWYYGSVNWVSRSPEEYDKAINEVLDHISSLVGTSIEDVEDYARKSNYTLDYLLDFAGEYRCLPVLFPMCEE